MPIMAVLLDVLAVRASGDPTAALVETDGPDREPEELPCDILVVGGGTGGFAAAVAAAEAAGRPRVSLLEETDWIGGQLTSQGVPVLDEHEHIERFGGTRTYYAVREAIRAHYRHLSPTLAAEAHPNPGHCWVSGLSFEPTVALRALEAIAHPLVGSGRLRILRRTKAISATTAQRRVESVLAVGLDDRRWIRCRPRMVVDATELGDMLPLVGADYVVGSQSSEDTGEPHARPGPAKTHGAQSYTYSFVVEAARSGRSRLIAKPDAYEHYRVRQPYSLRVHAAGHAGPTWVEYQVFGRAPGTKGGLWSQRRLIDHAAFPGCYPNDISVINFPGNDYRDACLTDASPLEQARALQEAKRVSLGFLYWLQTEAPRPDGARGFPELEPRPDLFGTHDGLAKYPYIRESRRIRALRTIVEQDVSAEYQRQVRARRFDDSVGVGWYPIDIHTSGPDEVSVSVATRPFQVPLGALLPAGVRNLIAGAKNIGTTHITNGCYRLHPVEWNIGEAAGSLAAFALEKGRDPALVCADVALRRQFQERLVERGVPLYWFVDVGLEHPAFKALQMAAVTGEIDGAPDSLEAAALPTATRRRVGLL